MTEVVDLMAALEKSLEGGLTETCDRCGARSKCYGLYVNDMTATEWVAVDSGFGDYVRVCEQCEVELTFA